MEPLHQPAHEKTQQHLMKDRTELVRNNGLGGPARTEPVFAPLPHPNTPGNPFATGHYNGCLRCPRIQGHYWIEEIFNLHGTYFSAWIANKLVEPWMLSEVSHTSLERWLSRAAVDRRHVDHLPAYTAPGIAVTLPDEIAIIDGNHRAARALRDGTQFVVYLLPRDLTQELIRLTAERASNIKASHA